MSKKIVINLDPSPGGQPIRRKSRRRWPRVVAILALLVVSIVVLAAAGVFFWWRHYQSTPAYSLTLLVDAAQRSDMQEFQQRIDDEQIAKNMIADVSQKAAARYGLSMNATVQQRIDKVMPSLLPQLKQTIHDEVAKELQSVASSGGTKSFVFLLLTVRSLVTITTEGDVAKAVAPLTGRAVELTMQRDADRWKVTGYKDEVVVQRVVDSVMKDLPAVGVIDPSLPLFKNQGRTRKKQK